MITKIKQYFRSNLQMDGQSDERSRKRTLDLAAAALLIEVARADFQMDSDELETVYQALKEQFGFAESELHELIELAGAEVEASISMHQFTALINDAYDYPQKLVLIESMWQVAYADGHLDKYEDYLIRKVADLIYVSHGDFIQRKLKVQSAKQESDNGQ